MFTFDYMCSKGDITHIRIAFDNSILFSFSFRFPRYQADREGEIEREIRLVLSLLVERKKKEGKKEGKRRKKEIRKKERRKKT